MATMRNFYKDLRHELKSDAKIALPHANARGAIIRVTVNGIQVYVSCQLYHNNIIRISSIVVSGIKLDIPAWTKFWLEYTLELRRIADNKHKLKAALDNKYDMSEPFLKWPSIVFGCIAIVILITTLV
jgi:hypothetical protein